MDEQGKLCPLARAECIENDCAWWGEGMEGCAVLAIAYVMRVTAGEWAWRATPKNAPCARGKCLEKHNGAREKSPDF